MDDEPIDTIAAKALLVSPPRSEGDATAGRNSIGSCNSGATTLDIRFQREVLPFSDKLFTSALRLTRSTQDAEDLVQETMLRAYAGFRSFQDGSNLNAWLYRIMHNTVINLHRKRKCRPAELLTDDFVDRQLANNVLRAPTAEGSAEAAALASLPDAEIKAALTALREDCRMTVYYSDVEGFSNKEIASMMNCSVGTVVSRLHRGRKRLRVALLGVAQQRGLCKAA
ncbi:sigma-70 family RNA polymerase sigma factor [Mycobacterium sp. UM_CSW]|uniref:sigma-70 family RNA polymerase sigma factor n=1 Tax=Mycobacterium sp. UM_CSW TaxID=1370119 RepID=UPI0003FB9C90|nr:sigma-70 family RNA polymerase sigma factor [Mycobacterium sp. UM_CSW]